MTLRQRLTRHQFRKRAKKIERRARRKLVGHRADHTGLISWFLAQCAPLNPSKDWRKRATRPRTGKRQLLKLGYLSKAELHASTPKEAR